MIEFLLYIIEPLQQCAFIREQQSVGTAQRMDVLARKAAPLQADDIETGQVGPVANRHAVGNEIVLQPRHAAEKSVRPDAGELDNRGTTAKDGEIADIAVPGQHYVVGKNHV